MTIANLIDPLVLPRFEDITPQTIGPALDAALDACSAAAEDIAARGSISFEESWMPLERASNALDALWSSVYHLNAVANTPEMRDTYAAGEARITEVMTGIRQNRPLYDVLVALSETDEFASRPSADRAAVGHAIRNARLAAVALEKAERDRYSAISIELATLSTQFQSAVLDATQAWFEHITDEALLEGLPETARATFAAAAKLRGLEGWCVTLNAPSVNAILMFAADRDLRARVYRAHATRASDQGPHAGQFDNSARIARILELRHEAARLLGFPDPVEWSLATKMAADSGQVLRFLRDLGQRAKPFAERDLGQIKAFAREALGITDLEPWDVSYASTQLRKARLLLDEEAIRAYFPVERVLEGWQSLLERLFGVKLSPRAGVSLPHPDARFYDVLDQQGGRIAGIYVDLHAREGKRGGAWMAEARPRLQDRNVRNEPVAYLNCNFAPATPDSPALLSHDDVITLLHETGHCLHHAFTTVDRPSVAGTNGVEWDAIELPSQLMEDFAWDRNVLTAMSGHCRTGEPLPATLLDRMIEARHFMKGLFVARQVELALFDIILHLGTMGSDPVEVIQSVRDEVAVIRPPAWHRFPHSFEHIFAGSYASGYYSYLWAEVLAADGFARFVEAGVVDRETGDAFRSEVLARGASRPAATSFRAFRGRDVDPQAMLIRQGLQS